MTDNRTNEQLSGNAGQFTDAQVEAAAKALREDKANRTDTYRVPEWEDMPYGDKLVYRGQARAALVAAQGAAPQAESVSRSAYISPSLPARIRGLYRADLRERSVQAMLDLAGDLIQELIDLRTAPVLPSSGVDEDKLAEVIGRDENYTREVELGGWMLDPRLAARAVAEWLKGQGGESRGDR